MRGLGGGAEDLCESDYMPGPGSDARILHLDLDAFFAAVEQRDKPSLRGKPVVVGGIGPRGVVSTASYEARKFGARSAMPTAEARRRCPSGTAFLAGRYEAYRISSRVVMELLHELSPVVEQVSVDEAYVDLSAGDGHDLSLPALDRLGTDLMARITERTGGLTASVGIASTKMMAKLGSEMRKPAGLTVIAPGTELDVLHPLSVRAVTGVGPTTAARLHAFGVETVADLARVSETDLVAIFGQAHGTGLHQLAHGVDERTVSSERETKSVSVEETFEVDIAERAVLEAELERLTRQLAARLGKATLFGRTITVKVRQHDFTQMTRSGTLPFATGESAVLLREGRRLLGAIDVSAGLRLLGIGVSGLTGHAQDELGFADWAARDGGWVAGEITDAQMVQVGVDPNASRAEETDGRLAIAAGARGGQATRAWSTGQDVRHTEHGAGWVWGSGLGRVTVRFEGPTTGPGRIRTFATDDPALEPADPPDWSR